MNKIIKHPRLKIIFLLILGAGSLLFAAAVFVPSNTPTLMVGQYALKNNDLLLGTTPAYRPWYENGAWQGDIIEYQILTDGTRQTDAAVGANPATAGTSGMCNFSGHSGSGCWTARATFHDPAGADADNPSGTFWQTRNIFTNSSMPSLGLTANSGQVDFTWDNLSAAQRESVDKETYDTILALNGYDATLAASDTSLNTAYASEILNYVRGRRLHEKINDTVSGSNGNFRSRYSVLGDITSSPIFIGPPREPYGSLDGFITFSTEYAGRDGRIAVGANDGMLHVFDEDDGSEVFAYVPSMVLDKLGKLTGRDTTYDHTYYVAGDLLSTSAYFDSEWHTVLVGGGGPGFAGLYALDITEADYPGSGDKLIFEKTSVDVDDSIGHIYGRPQIGALGDDSDTNPSWYVFSGSGYSTTAGHKTALVIISLDSPYTTCQIETGAFGGLSTPALLSTDVDNMVELAFAGDLNGDLWMFEFNQADPCATQAPIKVYDGSPDQPITAAPSIGKHPYKSGYMVYFGTGSLLSMDDALNDGLRDFGNPGLQTDYTKKQSVYGIWIDTESGTTMTELVSTPYDAGDLQTQTLVETTGTFNGVAENLRITPVENPLNYSCITTDPLDACNTNKYKGWKVDLPNCGERLIGSPFLRAKRVQFLTNNPTGPADACGSHRFPGDSWSMSLDWLTGASNDTVVYNLYPDEVLDNSDKVSYTDGNTGTTSLEAPVGINLGPGNIAQPTYARLTYGIDKMYINGIFLSIPPIPQPGPLLGGHIDVETDSPSNGVIATNDRDKHSEGYNNFVQGNDGMGRAVDGHVHDYDTMHDVEYVDLFQLEPRRGKANIVASLASTQDASCNSTTENEKGILVGSSCLEAIEGELNRAYDTLHTDQDGVLEELHGVDGSAVLQSEVNSFGPDSTFTTQSAASETPFIITLANADRSNAAWIQIGCKAWPVVEYQNMITGKLLDGRTDTTGLVDDEGDSLIFTLEGIINDFPDGETECSEDGPHGITRALKLDKGLSALPTLRIGLGQRSILDEGVHATRSQCVLGLHDPEDVVCYTDEAVLTAAETALQMNPDPDFSYSSCTNFSDLPTPPVDYIRDPARNLHITHAPSSEPGHYLGDCGYRWRNGALTVQLINAAIDPSADLQSLFRISGGGTHVKAFTVTNCGDLDYNNNQVEPYDNADSHGLLYEATMYWHYSDLVDKIRNSDPDGNTTPKDAPCYGGGSYSGTNTIDAGGLTLGEYNALTNPLVDECKNFDPNADPDKQVCDLERFGQLLDIIDSAASETILNAALLELAELLAQNQTLADYAAMRDYAGDKIPEHQKLTIDQQQCVGTECDPDATSNDGTPNDIELYEDSTPELAGPNSVFGRRNWIDLRQ